MRRGIRLGLRAGEPVGGDSSLDPLPPAVGASAAPTPDPLGEGDRSLRCGFNSSGGVVIDAAEAMGLGGTARPQTGHLERRPGRQVAAQ